MRLLLPALCTILAACTPTLASDLVPGTPAPGFSLPTVEGKVSSLADYRGHPLVLVYWRTAQDRSLQALRDASDSVAGHSQKEARLVSVISGDEDIEVAKAVVKARAVDLTVLIDKERAIFRDYGVVVYPSTFLIDGKGTFFQAIPGCPPTYKSILDSALSGMVGESHGSRPDASAAAGSAIEDKPAAEAARLHGLALTLAQSGMVEQALETVGRAVAADPDSSQSLVLQGFLELETRNPVRALDSFRAALKLDPRDHDACTGVGCALIDTGDFDGAIEFLKTCASTNPCPQVALYELGRAYEAKGEMDAARNMYRTAMEKVVKRQILPAMLGPCQ
ncbi:MAG: redoxin domain-containing protein [Acidobacteria bacterium]|nr:redoxin domain-containing protein [Acidobacteriota bacterium]